ncbi:MAG: hypothetical protein H6926_08940 [Chromatiales bacterium]|nr:hypothetical protein [Chromatiales bacterium]
MLSLCRTAVLLGTMLYLAGCDSIESALKEPADAFFAAVAINDTALAHRYLSASLATRTSVDGLAAFLKHTGLAQARETQWSTSKIEGASGSLDGEVTVDDQSQAVPVRISLVKDDLNWKIEGLARGVRVQSESGERVLFAPSDTESARMVQNSMSAFANAVQRNDLQGFWSDMADAFRKRYTADQFKAAFGGFVRDRVNLGAAAKLAPRFSAPPTLEPDGELVTRGVFPTRPSEVAFEYRYVNEAGSWSVSGMTVSLVPQG